MGLHFYLDVFELSEHLGGSLVILDGADLNDCIIQRLHGQRVSILAGEEPLAVVEPAGVLAQVSQG